VQTPVAASQVPGTWQRSEVLHTTGLPPVQTPAWQVSACVQPLPSLQAEPFAFAGLEQTPVPGTQTPMSWHWSEAVHVTAVPAVQTPAWQVSAPLHRSASAHDAPFAFAGFEHRPVVVLQVPMS